MAGLVPAIHVFLALPKRRTWMPGTRPGMTTSATERCRSNSPRDAAGKHAAVDDEFGSGYVARGVGGEIQHALRDFGRLAGAAERRHHFRPLVGVDRRILSGASRLRRDLAPDRGVDDTGMNRVDADAVAKGCTLHRDCLGEQPHAALGRAVTR